MNKNKHNTQQHGFTLLELMIVLAIFAILLAIAQPAYSRMIQRQDVAKFTRLFQSSLDLARQTAYVSGRDVTICPVNDTSVTTPACLTSWTTLNNTTVNKETGWIIFHDANDDHKVDTTETVYKTVPYNSNKTTVDWTRTTAFGITLAPRGSTGTTGTMRVYTSSRLSAAQSSDTSGCKNFSDWSAVKSKPPCSIANESRVALTSLGKVTVRK